LVSVPATIVARHRHLHHLDRTTGKPECHPHERTGARPGDEIIARGDEKAFVGKFSIQSGEEGIVCARGSVGARIKNTFSRRGERAL